MKLPFRTIRTLAIAAALVAPLAIAAPAARSAADSNVSPAQKAEFSKLVKQRNTLTRKLAKLDVRAAEMIKEGDDPVVIHAEQIGTQDQLDLIQLRLEILSTRLGLEVPPAINASSALSSEQAEDDAVDKRARSVLSRGRDRAMGRIEAQAKTMLASIDFSAFLASVEE